MRPHISSRGYVSSRDVEAEAEEAFLVEAVRTEEADERKIKMEAGKKYWSVSGKNIFRYLQKLGWEGAIRNWGYSEHLGIFLIF